MYKIIKKIILNSHVSTLLIEAPLIAAKAKPGQFIILRVDNNSERIPLTIAGVDTEKGLVKIIFQVVGSSTYKLNQLKENDFIQDFAGPLGKPTELEHLKNVLVIGGGVGCAIALPIAEYLHKNNCNVTSIIGFKNKDLIILEEDFKKCSNELVLTTDDGSYGFKGNCVDAMKPLLEKEKYDEIICIGPLIMMKFVAVAAKPYNVPLTCSMNSIMIDGTGMCGGCRLTLIEDGKRITKFACVDGPDFDGYKIDFDEAINRSRIYNTFEKHKYEETCNLYKEVK